MKAENFCKEQGEHKEISSVMTTPSRTEQKKNHEIRRLIGHLLLLYVIGNLSFSGILGLTSATSSLLPKENLGVVGLTVSNVISMIVALFIVAWINRLLGVKKVLTLGVFISILYPLSFFYPVSYIIIIGSICRGIGFALITSCIYIYGSKFIYRYQETLGGNLAILLVVVSSLNSGSIGGGYLLGNLAEYQILKPKLIVNASESDKAFCGINYCNQDLSNLTAVKPPSTIKYNILVGTYSGILFLAAVLCLWLETFPSEAKECTIMKELTKTIKVTYKQLLDPRSYLLIVITMFVGATEAFMLTVFTYAYVDCILGIDHVGKILLSYGVVQILMCFGNWLLAKTINRIPTLLLGCLLIIGYYVTLLLFPFTTTNYVETVYFVVLSTYAVAASIISTTTFSMYALVFPEDIGASYGLACLWLTAGAMICNATNSLFCVKTKLYLLTAFALISLLLFLYLEYLLRRKKLSSSNRKVENT